MGYDTEHRSDIYRMYDLTTQRVRISRDVRWLGKFHVEGKYVDIPGYSRNNEIQIIQYAADDNTIDEMKETEDAETNSEKENLHKKINHKLRRLHTSYNLTIYDITKILLVGGTDKNYESPMKFEDAQNNLDREMRDNWKNIIQKKFENMEKNDVWDICNINEKPENQ